MSTYTADVVGVLFLFFSTFWVISPTLCSNLSIKFLFLLSHFLISKNSLIFWMFLFYSIPISIYSKKKTKKTNLDISSQAEFNGRDWLNDIKRAGRAKGKRGRYSRIRKLPMLKAHTHCCSAGSMAPAVTALEPHQCYWAGIRSPRSSQCCCSHHWHRGSSCHPLLLLLPKALPNNREMSQLPPARPHQHFPLAEPSQSSCKGDWEPNCCLLTPLC